MLLLCIEMESILRGSFVSLASKGYTNNAALCIAYYLDLPRVDGGFDLQYGRDIDTDQLIAAANVCDETVALAEGGTVPRYTCNGSIQVSRGRERSYGKCCRHGWQDLLQRWDICDLPRCLGQSVE
jgi:hypothetical protein